MNGKGDTPRPISNYKQFINNWDSINWDENIIICDECGQSYKRVDRDKYMQFKDNDWACKGSCNFN